MASVDTQAIEGEIDRIRSLGLEDLRREWRRLNHGTAADQSRHLATLRVGNHGRLLSDLKSAGD
jgi:hypothetical protein